MAKKRKRSLLKMPPGWKVEAVSERMHKPCSTCGEAPKHIRVIQTVESIPFPTQVLHCAPCAATAIVAMTDVLREQAKSLRKLYATHEQAEEINRDEA